MDFKKSILYKLYPSLGTDSYKNLDETKSNVTGVIKINFLDSDFGSSAETDISRNEDVKPKSCNRQKMLDAEIDSIKVLL